MAAAVSRVRDVFPGSRLELRPYQRVLVEQLAVFFNGGGRSCVLQAGTGSGKTTMAAAIMDRLVGNGLRVVFLAHLDALIEDTAARLAAAGVPCGIVQADRAADEAAPVQVCSMATLHVRGVRPPADLVIVDECHRTMAQGVRDILDAYPEAWLLGLTATPQRGDGQPLGEVYEQIISGPSNAWLTEHCYLVPCDVLAPPTYLEDGLWTDPLAAYQEHAPGSLALAFCSTVSEARELAKRAGGAVMVGDTPRVERISIRERMRSGELRFLAGVGVFLEGFDLPAVETIILARGFGVTGAYLQAIGRGLRPWEDKERCTVLDLRGSCHLHGLPIEDRAWSLTGKAVVRTDTRLRLSHCPECWAVYTGWLCPRCGHEAKPQERVQRVLNRAERLQEFSAMPQAERDRRYMGRLLWVARTRLRKPEPHARAWALAKFQSKWGRKPHEGS